MILGKTDEQGRELIQAALGLYEIKGPLNDQPFNGKYNIFTAPHFLLYGMNG